MQICTTLGSIVACRRKTRLEWEEGRACGVAAPRSMRTSFPLEKGGLQEFEQGKHCAALLDNPNHLDCVPEKPRKIRPLPTLGSQFTGGFTNALNGLGQVHH